MRDFAKKVTAYVTSNGNYGCLPDNVETFESYKDACAYLSNLFELDEEQEKYLHAYGYLDLGITYGADYCSIDTLTGEAAIETLATHY